MHRGEAKMADQKKPNEHKVYHSLYMPLLFGGVPDSLVINLLVFNLICALIFIYALAGKAIYPLGTVLALSFLLLAIVRKGTKKDPQYWNILKNHIRHTKPKHWLKNTIKYWR